MRGVANEGFYCIAIRVLQSRQFSETSGAACHEEVYQCPAR